MATTVAQPLEYQFAQIPGVVADDLGQRARAARRSRCSSTSTATSTPRPATCRRRSTPPAGSCRRTCRARRPTARSIRPTAPILILAVQSDALPLIEVDDYADNILAQQISQIAGVVAGVHRRRAEARGARAGRSGEARRDGPDAGGRARNADQRHGRTRPRAASTAATQSLHDLRQRPAHQGAPSTTTSSSAYRNGAPVRVRDIGHAVDGPENRAARRLAERQARHPAAGVQAAGRQRDRHGGADQGRAAAAGGGDPAVDPRQRGHRTAR